MKLVDNYLNDDNHFLVTGDNNNGNQTCPPKATLPSIEQYQEAFGGWLIALYVTASVGG